MNSHAIAAFRRAGRTVIWLGSLLDGPVTPLSSGPHARLTPTG